MKCSRDHPEAICYTGCVSARFQGSRKTHYTCSGRQAATKERTDKVVVKSEETAPFVDMMLDRKISHSVISRELEWRRCSGSMQIMFQVLHSLISVASFRPALRASCHGSRRMQEH